MRSYLLLIQNMKCKYKHAIFDLDGTLLDTSGGILSSVSYVISINNLRKIEKEELLSFIGPPIQESFKRTYGISDSLAQQYGQAFRDRYKNYDLLIAEPYDGIYALMEKLKENGIIISVATYKREDYALTILEHFGFDKYAMSIHGADNDNQLKKKDIIALCISEINIVDKNKIVYIGDTKSDLNAAEALGIDFIGVNYGFGFKNVKNYANNPVEILRTMEDKDED